MNRRDYNRPATGKVGRKDYDREPLPPTIWRCQLRELAKWTLCVIALLFCLAIAAAVLT